MNSEQLTGIVEELKEQINVLERRVHDLESRFTKALSAIEPKLTTE